jgi:hypothetical protein
VKRETTEVEPQASAPDAVDPQPTANDHPIAAHTLAGDIRHYAADLEIRYVAARDAWKHAMRAANSGRSKDLASLAIAQQAYEEVAAEREHWVAGGRVAIPVEPDPQRRDIEVAVGQELEWRKVLHTPAARGFFGRIKDRLGGR